MEFIPLKLAGVYGIRVPVYSDLRGTLKRIFDSDFNPIDFNISQSSIVFNPLNKTLRGLHFQTNEYSENKFVQCFSGRIFDVLVDLREESQTYLKHISVELGPNSAFSGLLVPRRFAHGYLTLQPHSNLIYFMDRNFSQEFSNGCAWDDPKLGIKWPAKPKHISQQDQEWKFIE